VERIERRQQLGKEQAQAARLADASIASALDDLEYQLRRAQTDGLQTGDQSLKSLRVFSMSRSGLLTFIHEKVYFSDTGERPDSMVWSEATEQLIDQAQSAQAQGRAQAALTAYRRIIDREPALKQWAEMSINRIQKGDASSQIIDLSEADGITPTGLPAALVACAQAEQPSVDERSVFIANLERTLESLRSGRWLLSYDERQFYDAELRGRLGGIAEDERLEALAEIERIVRMSPPSRRDAATRLFEHTERGPFLIICLSAESGDRVGAALSEIDIAGLLDEKVKPMLGAEAYLSSVRDSQGRVLWGANIGDGAISLRESLRSVSGWEIAFSDSTDAYWIDRRTAMWGLFVLLLVLMLIAGLATTARVVRREKELARLQNEFIAAVSHEFKSPITSIRLLMERIIGGRARAEQLVEYGAGISREMSRLERHVNRLLDAQQTQEGRRRHVFTLASLVEIAGDAIRELQPQAEAKGIALESRVEGELPQTMLDRAAMTDAIENLIENAIKYSPSGTQVKVVVRSFDHQVSVEVIDEGEGIDAEDLPRVFDRFYRARRGDRQSVRGTGLGLSLVKSTLEAHGGSVEAASEPGLGSRFTLRLPVDGGNDDGESADS
jgi:signal transduction histidine kinase